MRALLLLFLAATLGCREPVPAPEAPPAPPPAAPKVAPEFVDLGPLSKPPLVAGRDGGAAGLVGGKMLWVFQDTLLLGKGADGKTWRTSTAGIAEGAGHTLAEPLDAAGAPFEFLPYTPEEKAYNDAGGPNERYALWPSGVLAEPDGTALVPYIVLEVHPHGDFDWEGIGMGIAHVRPGATVAEREPGLLFRAPERSYGGGGFRHEGFVYMWSVEPVKGKLDSLARLARVPAGKVAERAAWTAWDGQGWNADLARAIPVLHGPAGGLSVSYNAHVRGWLAVYSGVFSNDVHYRTSPRPEGPWSDEKLLFTAMPPPPPAKGSCYAAMEHPELSSNGGRTLVVGYARGLGNWRGEIRLAAVTLP